MWEAWELLPNKPDHIKSVLGEFEEPSISELKSIMNARSLEQGFELRFELIVLPLSMSQYRAAFLADEAPYGLEQQM